MRASDFENILAASELYGSNQIGCMHFSVVIDNFYNASDFWTLIYSQKKFPIVKALNIDFHGKFQDKFLLCNLNIFLLVLKAC